MPRASWFHSAESRFRISPARKIRKRYFSRRKKCRERRGSIALNPAFVYPDFKNTGKPVGVTLVYRLNNDQFGIGRIIFYFRPPAYFRPRQKIRFVKKRRCLKINYQVIRGRRNCGDCKYANSRPHKRHREYQVVFYIFHIVGSPAGTSAG